jgi:DNA-binding NarL/FixJ family response regulator
MKNHVPTLIVARPGRMRDGLRALLRATPRLELVGQADSSSSALTMVRDRQPSLILLDCNLPGDEVQSVLEQMKLRSPATRCVVLATDAQQQWVAKAAGADSVLLAGFPVAKFFAVIEELLANGEPELD